MKTIWKKVGAITLAVLAAGVFILYVILMIKLGK